MQYFFAPSYRKLDKKGGLCSRREYTVRLAQNESEGCTLALVPQTDLSGVKISVSPFEDGKGGAFLAEVFKQIDVPSEKLEYTVFDPIVPVDKIDVALEAGAVNPFLVRLTTQKDTPAGSYQATITVSKDGESLLEAKISAIVWNFALPGAFTEVTAFGIGRGESGKFCITDAQYKEYYDLLLSFGVCGYALPYDILSDEADAYMNDPRVKSFLVPYPQEDEKLRAYYEKLSKNPEWMKKAYFYPLDEPTSEEHYNDLVAHCDRLKKNFPGYRIVTPFFKHPDLAFKYMTGNVNVWCPLTGLFDEPFTRAMRDRKSLGEDVWWYVCCLPMDLNYNNLFTNMQGLQHRVLFWQQMQYGIEGLLYWSTTFWSMVGDPWEEMITYRHVAPRPDEWFFGDGMLFYPGEKIGVPGPIASLRLEIIRDGIEDYEYLTMAKKLLGQEFVDGIIKKVSKSITEGIRDDEAFAAVRIELGEAIERASI